MRFIFKLILIAGISYILELFLPWWSVVVAAFLVNLWLPTKGLSSFLSGFLGVGLIWLIYAWLIDTDTGSIMSERISNIFGLGNPALMIALTGLAGGLAGGFAGLSGSQLRRIFTKDTPKRGYYA